MSKGLSREDIDILAENWSKIRKIVIKLIKKRAKSTIDVAHAVPMTFDRDLILGHGKWGLVVGMPSLEEIVIKLTTDPFEWYLMDLIMHDDELRNHPAVPFTLGTAVLDLKSKDMPLYLIVRENLHIGIPLNLSNPLVKMKDILIRDFVDPMENIEHDVAEMLNKRGNISLLDISVLHSLMNGEIKKQVGRIKAKLPRVAAGSRFFNVLDLQKKLLDRGIALIDIHVNNLGTRQFKNLNRLFDDVGRLDMENVVISDLGMAYGTPIFLQSGMIYKDIEDMVTHLASILVEYSDQRPTMRGVRRSNPALYSVESICSDLIACCQDANLNLTNVLLDKKSNIHIDRIVSNLVKLVPQMHLDAITVAFVIKNELISIIKAWINPHSVLEISDNSIGLRCYVDAIQNGSVRCRLAHDLMLTDEAPIGYFVIPQSQRLAEELLNFYTSTQKRRSSKVSVQHIPLSYLSTLNGASYESIQGI